MKVYFFAKCTQLQPSNFSTTVEKRKEEFSMGIRENVCFLNVHWLFEQMRTQQCNGTYSVCKMK